jgi:hypothetical protein
MRDPAARMLKERQPDEPRTDQIEQFNAQLERLRLAAIAGGKESHDAILEHLAEFKT